MTWGLLFPGQGSQHAGMLPWLDTASLLPATLPTPLRLMQETLGLDWRQRLGDPAWANSNEVAQTLVTGCNLAAWATVQPMLPAPAVVAGYSVGELAAASAAGVVEAGTALRWARQRAALMDHCVRQTSTGLLAVSAAPPGLVDALCRRFNLHVAIETGDDSCILGGQRQRLTEADQAACQAGARTEGLPVSLASHTPWLQASVEPFAALLTASGLARPRWPLVCNFTGQVQWQATDVVRALSGQLSATVKWRQCMDTVAERGVHCVLEVGPGCALARLWRHRHPGIPARSVDEFHSPCGAASWVREHLQAD